MAEASREIMKQLPYLRRYARAISGSQERGDRYIRVALETIVQEPGRIDPDANVKQQLFQLFHDVWTMVDSAMRRGDGAPAGRTIEAHRVQHCVDFHQLTECRGPGYIGND